VRRLLSTLALVACLTPPALSACGGGDGEAATPLDAGLAYLPEGAPFAVAIDTDLDGDQYKAIDSILAKFPLEVTSVKELLRRELAGAGSGVDFEEDIEPILGNPFVVGAIDDSFVRSSTTSDFVAAIQTTDKAALEHLLDKSHSRKTGDVAGATEYEQRGSVFAVDGDVVVFAGTTELLDQALERADDDNHLDPDTFEDALEGLPESAAARVYADMEALLAGDPGTMGARRLKWIGALRTLGVTASADEDEVELQMNLRTDPAGLSDEDLPIAAGDESPPVLARDGEIGFGIRDPAQIIDFAEATAQALNPSGFGEYEQAKQTLDTRLDISIDDDLFGQLTGDASASVALDGSFGVRAEVEDPARLERTLAKIADVLPSFARGAGLGPVMIQKPTGGEGLYTLAQPDGDGVVFGVSDDVLVVASDQGRARVLAGEDPEPVDGAEGAVTMSADAQELANAVVDQFGEQLGVSGLQAFGAQLFTGPLEDMSGWMSASTEGLRGRFSLGIE
jgi:Protein of unknown function (DUF3352)